MKGVCTMSTMNPPWTHSIVIVLVCQYTRRSSFDQKKTAGKGLEPKTLGFPGGVNYTHPAILIVALIGSSSTGLSRRQPELRHSGVDVDEAPLTVILGGRLAGLFSAIPEVPH